MFYQPLWQGLFVEFLDGYGMTKEKFTYQLSDHLPLWIQINTATEGFKLEQIVRG